MTFGHAVPDGFVTRKVVRRHRVEARIVGVLHDVVKAKADVGRDVGGIRTIDDASFQCGKDLSEIHHDRGCTKVSKHFSRQTWG